MDEEARVLRDTFRDLVLAQGVLDDAKRPCGTPLPLPRAYALLELLRAPMTVGELAARLSIDRTNVSRLCARMETDGEIAREAHPDDGRARLLRLTRAGAKLARSVDRESAAYFARVLGRLGRDGDRVIAAMQRFHEVVVNMEGEVKA